MNERDETRISAVWTRRSLLAGTAGVTMAALIAACGGHGNAHSTPTSVAGVSPGTTASAGAGIGRASPATSTASMHLVGVRISGEVLPRSSGATALQ